MPVGFPYNPNECCFLLSQSLNANQFNPNVPDTGNLVPHNLLWNFITNTIQWVRTSDNIIVQELGASANDDYERIVLVDGTFGNDLTAVLYNQTKPFQTVDAAIAAAQDGDLIVVNPNNAPYNVFSNLFSPGISFYLKKGVILNVFSATASAGSSNISILGEGDINFYTSPTLSGTYSGDVLINCINYLMTGNFSFVGGFNGDFIVNCVNMTNYGYFYYENSLHWPIATAPTNFTINASGIVLNNTILFFIYPATVNADLNIFYYESHIPIGINDVWCYGAGTPTYKVTCYFNFERAFADKSSSPDARSIFQLAFGTSNNTTYITGEYRYLGNGILVNNPSLIGYTASSHTVFFNGVAYITKGSMFVDLNATGGKIRFDGKVYIDNSTIATQEYLFSGYFVSQAKVEIAADTIIDSPNNHCILIGDYSSSSPVAQVDVIDCEIVNTNPAAAKTNIIKGINAFSNLPTGVPWGTLRLQNAKILNANPATPTITGGNAAEPVEVYTAYANTPQVSIANTIAGTAIITDPAVTSNNF